MALSRRAKAWLIPIGSAVMFSLALPPFNLVFLVFVAIAPWLAWLRRLDAREARRSGYLFGSVLFLFQMFWVGEFVAEWTGSWWLGLVPWLVSAALAGWYFVLLAWLLRSAMAAKWFWAVPLVWAAVEALRAYFPVLAFPWAILAHPLWMVPDFVQHAAFGTVFLVSAWAVVPNLLLCLHLWPVRPEDREPRQSVRLGLVFGGFLVLSTFRAAQPVPADERVVTLGQPGIDMAFNSDEAERRLLDESVGLIRARVMEEGTDLLVLPEGFAAPSQDLPPSTILGPEPAFPVIFGGNRIEGSASYQTAYAYDGTWQSADKTRLVVFGEFVPFRGLPFMSSFRLPSGDLTPAKELKQLKVGDTVFGPLLCFEGLFPDLAARHTQAGARVLVQMSVDDWYERTPAWDQLWQSSIWRSIESGVPIVRVGSRGRTLVTDPRGRLVHSVPKGVMAAERARVLVPKTTDAFPQRFAFVYVAGAVAALVALRGLRHRSE